MKKIGFTGTSRGMTPEQKIRVRELLTQYRIAGATDFHHGLCIGADQEAAEIAHLLGYHIIAHPGFNPKNPTNRIYRSEFPHNDEIHAEKPFIKRDHDIVDATDHLIAAPLTWEEEIRSGTWATVRYAEKKNKPRDMVYPVRIRE
jgi:hypothetical protein